MQSNISASELLELSELSLALVVTSSSLDTAFFLRFLRFLHFLAAAFFFAFVAFSETSNAFAMSSEDRRGRFLKDIRFPLCLSLHFPCTALISFMSSFKIATSACNLSVIPVNRRTWILIGVSMFFSDISARNARFLD